MVRTRGGRLAALAAAIVVAAAVAAACSSGSPSPKPTPAPAPAPAQSLFAARSIDSAALLAQCALSRGVTAVVTSAQQANQALPAGQQWLHGSKLVLTKANLGLFDAWFAGHAAGVVVHGKSLDNWEEYAGNNDQLPAAVCGAGVSARSLHDQIYAQYPSMKKNNPWGA